METGQLSQIIQGGNLRCLYAHIPPSYSNTRYGSQNSYSSYSQYGASQQSPDRASVTSLNSVYTQFGQQYGAPVNGYAEPLPHKIIMVSDDSVISLRPAVPTDPTWTGGA